MEDILDYKVEFSKDVENYFIQTMGNDYYTNICKKACCPPSNTCIRINPLQEEPLITMKNVQTLIQEYNNQLIHYNLEPVQPIFWNNHNNMIIIPSHKAQIEDIQELKKLPLCIIDRICGESVLRGSNIYVKGIRFITKSLEIGQKVAIAVEISTGENHLPRGSDIQLYKDKLILIGSGIMQTTSIDVFRNDKGLAIDTIQSRYYIFPSLNTLPKSCFLQNLPSYLVPYILNPKETDTILDMCASPGGKTTLISQLMNNRGKIIATDRSKNKLLSEVYNNIKKLNCKNIYIRCCDMSNCLLSISEEKQLKDEDESFKLKEERLIYDTSSIRYKKKLMRIYKQKLRKQNDKNNKERNSKDMINDNDIVIDTKDMNLFINKKINESNDYIESTKTMQTQESLVLHEYLYPFDHKEIILERLLYKCQEKNSIKVPGFPRESFDRILLDPPCSALGLRPRLYHKNIELKELTGYRDYQRKFIDNAVRLLKVGGILVYSTCTINPMENEENVQYILSKYPMKLIPTEEWIYKYSEHGIDNILTPEQTKLVIRFSMSDINDSNGFFAAKFEKLSTIEN